MTAETDPDGDAAEDRDRLGHGKGETRDDRRGQRRWRRCGRSSRVNRETTRRSG
jgi:hypothetical protein